MSLHEPASLRPTGLAGPAFLRAIWSPVTQNVTPIPGSRDARLDMFRGLALVMIFINHVPGTIFESLTSRNFGFSDAAEAFVFMSGMAAGLAYSNRFRTGSPWAATARVWARARQLYLVHITITVLSLAIFASAALRLNLPELLTANNIAPLFSRPLSTMLGIPLLTHQLGYLNILPLYMVLLLATPLIIIVGLKRPLLVAVIAVFVWALAGQFRLNFPNFPNQGGWFFNPLSWQLLFVVGLLAGMAMKVGDRFVPYRPWLFGVAAGFLVFTLLWMKVPFVGKSMNSAMAGLSSLGMPFYVTWFDKTFLSLPRLLHAFALFYVLGHLPIMRTLSESAIAAPLRLMGQHGLAIFATGTVLSMVLQVAKASQPPSILLDGVLIGSGLLALVALAWALSKTAELSRPVIKPRPDL